MGLVYSLFIGRLQHCFVARNSAPALQPMIEGVDSTSDTDSGDNLSFCSLEEHIHFVEPTELEEDFSILFGGDQAQ